MANHHHYGHRCEICNPRRGGNSPLTGPMLGRRKFFKIAGAGIVGSYLLPALHTEVISAPTADLHLVGKARNCIFILLNGAPSHVDTFDLKVGTWTPTDFNPTSYNGVMFPQGLMPNLAEQLNNMSIIRNLRAPALVHTLQQSWAQIARSPASALGSIAPNIGSVVALEFEAQRTAAQKIPTFVSLNTGGSVIGAGYFPGLYAPFDVTASATGLSNLTNADGQTKFETRYGVLQSIDGGLRTNSPLGSDVSTMGGFYDRSKAMMYDANVDAVFKFSIEDQTRYGDTNFGNSAIVARNLVKSNLGTRFVQINHGGWDNHDDIYDTTAGIYPSAKALDAGLANLLKDLAALPGVNGGTLLDETLVVAMGEFGRTVGAPTSQAGRDHYYQHFAVMAGGGVIGGRVIGATDATGSAVETPGWSQERPSQYEDIAATIYAALGINYLTIRNDDPFGRGFEYVPFANEGGWYPMTEVFDRSYGHTPRGGSSRGNTTRAR